VKTPTNDTPNAVETPVIPRAAYVHVPFCRHRCGYCDFALIAGRDDLIADYLAAIQRELTRLDAVPDLGPGDACLELATLYLGGGTPSHLGPDGLARGSSTSFTHGCGRCRMPKSRSRPILRM
jgi:coproporphyrinogen III oxidase-like Fe-S oxidoreductase